MGKYDFTTLPNRFGHHTYKWKEAETDRQVLPAWIADMDFEVYLRFVRLFMTTLSN